MKKTLAALALLLAEAAFPLLMNASELPVETLFRAWEWSHMKLSPDGKNVAAFGLVGKERAFVMCDLETRVAREVTRAVISDFIWVNNERLILKTGGFALGGLLAINRDGTGEKMLVPPLAFQATHPNFRFHVVDVLGILGSESGEILVESAEINPYIRPEIPRTEVRRINVFSGKSTVAARNSGRVIRWVNDHDGEVRAAVAIEKDKLRLLYRRNTTTEWEVLNEFDLAGDGIWPLEFTPDNRDLYARTRNGKDTDGLYRFDVEKKALGECLWQDDRFDFRNMIHTHNGRALGVYVEEERPRIYWLDPQWKAVQGNIDAQLPGTFNEIVSNSRDGTRTLCRAWNDRTPGHYYVFDGAGREIKADFPVAPWIKSEQMAPMKPIQYQARDGLTVHGYLTVPLGGGGRMLPLIVYPHGGPWLRDTWGFDPDVQFFAGRGYAVLQMNFRGSTGYGDAFERAGFRQWGLAMQDDITDGVKWAIQEGIADSGRICIYGSSYGGFAAMVGLTRTPELYKCAINYAGVSDVESLLRYQSLRRPEQFRMVQRMMVGDFVKEKKELEEISPVHHVDQIRVPVLLAYGGRDPIVRIDQGKKLAKALEKHGKSFELIIEEKEGHGFTSEAARSRLYRKIDQFLRENL